jgi:hypothetical protein
LIQELGESFSGRPKMVEKSKISIVEVVDLCGDDKPEASSFDPDDVD